MGNIRLLLQLGRLIFLALLRLLKRRFCRFLVRCFRVAPKALHRLVPRQRHHVIRIHAIEHQVCSVSMPELVSMKLDARLLPQLRHQLIDRVIADSAPPLLTTCMNGKGFEKYDLF